MRSKFISMFAVIGAAVVLVLAANTVALATTGKALIAGKSNTSSKVTTIKRTKAGPVAKLTTKNATDAPLVVNGKGKVGNLNADLLDGLDSTSLRANTYLWTKSVTSPAVSFSVAVPLPRGTYVIGYDTEMVDGGTDTGTARCYFFKDPLVGPNTFYAKSLVATRATSGADPGLSATGVITVNAGDIVKFYCLAPVAFTTATERPIQVFATKAGVVGGGTL
jgi:hypothetical protein